ncbi:hypothetical protein [Dysgonomonas capnocytophagoides]|uniref:hypothetical protein n=1 Tax=Dysgonomonas capnocytophagoides TaxID=45254 RepID=UPI00333E3BC3
MKILIFENDYDLLEDAFNLCNDLYFKSIFTFEVYPKFQDFRDINKLNEYALIFVDILLAKKSHLDGFGILRVLEEKGVAPNKVIILTGHELLKDEIKERGINNHYEILTKPIYLKALKAILEKAIPLANPLS